MPDKQAIFDILLATYPDAKPELDFEDPYQTLVATILAAQCTDKRVNQVTPAVFRDFEASGLQWMESAILFESGAYRLVDKTIIVSAPEEVRIQRVMQRDGISREKVLEWMARQLPQEDVRRRADFEIINDGEADIDQQLKAIIEMIKEK